MLSVAPGGLAERGFGRLLALTASGDRPVNYRTIATLRGAELLTKFARSRVVWEFLQQKTELQDVDHELFNLLAAHAATAIYSAQLAQG